MSHPAATLPPATAPAPRTVRVAAPPTPALAAPVARRVLTEAALLGLTADALFRQGLVGLALPLWVALLALALVALAWRAGRPMPREAAGWLGAAVLFAASTAWRDAGMLQFAGVLATLLSLLMAALALHDAEAALFAARLRDLVWAGFTTLRGIAAGVVPMVFHEAVIPGEAESVGRRAMPAVRAGLFAGVLVVVFGALLRGADPIFASLVSLPDIDTGEALSHLVVAGFFAWIVAGWARAALDTRDVSPLPAVPSFSLGALEVTAALGALNALFAAYVLTQLGWFFGGERFLHERTGLTAAAYAREGFFQMLCVVLLVVPLLLATRAMLRDDRALARRHTALSLPLLGLLGAMIVSAAARMRLYVHYYGLTTDRFYPMVLMAWLALVLVWLACTVLRGRGERFVAGAVLSGLATLLVLDLSAPDAIIARVNIARSAAAAPGDTTRQLDLEHLVRLSGEAMPLAVGAVLAAPAGGVESRTAAEQAWARCEASENLLGHWGPASRRAHDAEAAGAWRTWNAGERTALGVVAANAARLRGAGHESCTLAKRAGKTASPVPARS